MTTASATPARRLGARYALEIGEIVREATGQELAIETLAKISGRVREAMAAEVAPSHEALRRARRWGLVSHGYVASVAIPLADWIDTPGRGPLPDLPDYLPKEKTND